MAIRLNPIIINKNVSKSFAQSVQNDLEKLPKNIKKSVKKHDNKYILSQQMSDLSPQLKGQRPRGWPEGTTWDDCEAACNGKQVAFFEKAFAKSQAPIKGTVYHETGHLIDETIKNVVGTSFCETEGFQNAYNKDLAAIYGKFTVNNKLKLPLENLNYFLQGSTPSKPTLAGLQETFAEVFTVVNDAFNSKSYNKFILQNFKNTVEYVDKFMCLFGGKK